MELQGERTIPADVPTTWAALNDPETLKACIAGCESLERTGEDAYTAVVAMKIGPVSARFKGNLQLQNLQPPNSYTIVFDGQGGVAGFGKGSADVALSPGADAGTTVLRYAARATVGGKMAQVGARLIDAAAGKITDDFFKAFEGHLTSGAVGTAAPDVATAGGGVGGAIGTAGAAGGSAPAPARPAGDELAPDRPIGAAAPVAGLDGTATVATAPTAAAATAATPAAAVPRPAPAPGAEPPRRGGTAVWWIIGAVIVLGAVWMMLKR